MAARGALLTSAPRRHATSSIITRGPTTVQPFLILFFSSFLFATFIQYKKNRRNKEKKNQRSCTERCKKRIYYSWLDTSQFRLEKNPTTCWYLGTLRARLIFIFFSSLHNLFKYEIRHFREKKMFKLFFAKFFNLLPWIMVVHFFSSFRRILRLRMEATHIQTYRHTKMKWRASRVNANTAESFCPCLRDSIA